MSSIVFISSRSRASLLIFYVEEVTVKEWKGGEVMGVCDMENEDRIELSSS